MTFKVIPAPETPLKKAGIYSGVSIERYHGKDLCIGPSVSSSGLRTILNQSPAHYWATSPYNGSAVEREESDAMVIGRATHHALIGDGGDGDAAVSFKKTFVVRPENLAGTKWNSNRNDCKAWLADAEASGLTVLTPNEWELIRGMRAGLAQHPLVQAGILDGLIEHTIVWQDKETGIWLKVRPDAIPRASNDAGDLKTTVSTNFRDLAKTIGTYGYHIQGALIAMAWRIVLGHPLESFNLVFVEKKPPHCARVVTLKPADLALGEQQARVALRMFKRGIETGKWPGPGGEVADAEYIDLPDWARRQGEDQIKYATAAE